MGRQIGAVKPSEDRRPRSIADDLLTSERYAPLWLVPRLLLGFLSLKTGWAALQGPATGPEQFNQPLALLLTLAGIALILGLFTAPAALVAGCLSAGMWANQSPAIGAGYLALAIVLLLAWKTAGWFGLDRWVLPLLGLTGHRGALLRRDGTSSWR
jgi:hypothetical protein